MESSISLTLKIGAIVHASRNSAAAKYDEPKASMSRNNGIIMFWLHVQVITVVKLECWKVERLKNGVEWTSGTQCI